MSDDNIEFKCSQCGACCIIAGRTGLMPSKKDGSCIYLNSENQCDIYEDRPEECNVKRMFAKGKRNSAIPKTTSYKQFCIDNTKMCHVMIDHLELDPVYKIDIGDYEI